MNVDRQNMNMCPRKIHLTSLYLARELFYHYQKLFNGFMHDKKMMNLGVILQLFTMVWFSFPTANIRTSS
uniref:Uncharacterized protein n=1 Tax=Populus trichocarpa TaxID=3694 RepID=A0A2K2A3X7_POPTR